jgi:nucleotide-binding universal stress UspA family protein
MINKIVLAVAGSENVQRATEIAAKFATKLKADFFIVHVLMHDRPPEELVRI